MTNELPPMVRSALSAYRHAGIWTEADHKRHDGFIRDAIAAYAAAAVLAERELYYKYGWLAAAEWAGRDDLVADIGSKAYERTREFYFKKGIDG
jgi:hypothetical protein